jgi:FtsH-binding integral membrane protein
MKNEINLHGLFFVNKMKIDSTEIIAGNWPGRKFPFAVKVYLILSLQLALTVGVVCAVMFPPKNRQIVLDNSTAALISAFVVGFITMITATLIRHGPFALVSLAVFTAAESVIVSIPCAVYYEIGHGYVVLAAFGMTLVLFVLFSLIGWAFGQHFQGCGPYLFGTLLILIFWGLLNIIFGWNLGYIYSMCGAIIFSLFVIYDTNELVTRHKDDNNYI